MRNRMTLILSALVCLLLNACAPQVPWPTYPTGVQLQAHFEAPEKIEGIEPNIKELDYLLYLPQEYGIDPQRKWPLIYFLHGSGDEDYDSAWVMSYGLPSVLQLNEQPENFEFIVVSPQASPGSAWWHNDQLLVLNALLEEVLETYPIDPARVYLTGLSMGGYGSWYLATRYPDRFAAMISISGSGYRTTALPAADVVCKLNALPIWAIHGAEDQISAVGINERVVSSYQQRCGQEVRWTLYPDSGHFETYERAYRDPELYAWLLAQSRTTESATESTP